ncbi:MAG: M1 family metallopeptidase [Promethearchaeota archaeon]
MTLRVRSKLALGILCTLVFAIFFPMVIPTSVSCFSTNDIQCAAIPSEKIQLDSVRVNESRESIDGRALMNTPYPITNYTIFAVLQDWNHIVMANTTIAYVNQADVSFSELYFHLYPNAFQPLGSIEVFNVSYNSHSLSYLITGEDQTILEVDLVSGSGPGVLSPGGILTLVISWQVTVPESQDRFGWYERTDPFDFLGYNLGNWHPIVAVYDERGWDTKPYSFMGESFYSDVATYNVSLTVPDDYIVAATGELQDITVGASTRDWHFTTGPVRDFTWCASPDYETDSILTQSVNVTSYYVSNHASGGQRVLEVAQQCLEIYGNLFGPYSWDSLAIVETDIWAGGMEYPQLVMIGQPLYTYSSGLSSLAAVTAHEIGHEWVPFTIGTDSYTEPWIDEGFASYCEYAWVEYVYGGTARGDYRQTDYDGYWEYVNTEGDKSINQSMDYWQTTDWYAYGRIVYVKSALLYDMLRHQLGNQTFYDAWQYVYVEAMHRNLRAYSLQELFEEAIGESLDWFFDPWVYGSGIVTLGLSSYSIQAVASGWQINFQIQQYQPTPVRLRIPVSVNHGASTTQTWIWVDAQTSSSCVISTPELPLFMALDPGRVLLCQYRSDSAILSFALGSPIPLAIGIVVGVVIITLAVVIYRRRQSSISDF